MSLFSIDLFLMDYAKPAASGAQGQASKGKSAAGEAKSKQNDGKASTKSKDDKATGSSASKDNASASKKGAKGGGNNPKPNSEAKSGGKVEPPVYGDPPKKKSREGRGGEL